MVGLLALLLGTPELEVYTKLRLTNRPTSRTESAGSLGPRAPSAAAACRLWVARAAGASVGAACGELPATSSSAADAFAGSSTRGVSADGAALDADPAVLAGGASVGDEVGSPSVSATAFETCFESSFELSVAGSRDRSRAGMPVPSCPGAGALTCSRLVPSCFQNPLPTAAASFLGEPLAWKVSVATTLPSRAVRTTISTERFFLAVS